jgi:hypothetical protein
MMGSIAALHAGVLALIVVALARGRSAGGSQY